MIRTMRTSARPTLAVVGLAASMALAACSATGGGAAPPSSATASATAHAASPTLGMAARMAWHEGQPTPDGCLVATMDEVSAASGFKIVRTLSMQSYEPGCLYFDADGQVLSTRFFVRESGEAHFAAELARTDHIAIAGIGDQAIWIPRLWAVMAWQGDMLVTFGIGHIGETPERLDLAKKLGPFIVDRFR